MKKRVILLSLFVSVVFAPLLQAQNVGIGNTAPDASALVDISSTNKGMLVPRMVSTQRVAIPSPAKGLLVFDNSTSSFWFYNGTQWKDLSGSSTDSIWSQVQDTIATTNKPYVGINTDFTFIKPQANLHTTGNFLVQGKLDFTNTAPTVAQTYTMNNLSVNQTIPSTDSVFRLYDPGGTGNYSNNMQGNVVVNSNANEAGLKIKSSLFDFEMALGDTLWISDLGFPGCRTNYNYRFTSASTNPGEFIINDLYQNFIFRSNANGINGKGFNFLVTRLYKTSAADKIQTAGAALYFNTGSASFSAGENSKAEGLNTVAIGTGVVTSGNLSVAMGYRAKASGDRATAIGDMAYATGWQATALGYATQATGDNATALGNANTASGHNSTAMGLNTIASGGISTAMGTETKAEGAVSVAMGSYTTASGDASVTTGLSSIATGTAAVAMGQSTIAAGFASLVTGIYNAPLLYSSQTAVTSTTPLFTVGNGDGSTRSNALVVLKNGNVGIGTSSDAPDGNLVINDNTNSVIQFKTSGTDIGFLQTSGNNFRIGTNSNNTTGNMVVRLNGADRLTVFPNGNATLTGTLTQSSDARLKQHITIINGALPKLMQLNGYQYTWKPELKKDMRLQTGLIAQNVETVFPELVTADAEGMKSVAYQNLVPVLIEAVKEQQRQIAVLKKQVTQLHKKIRSK